jgi:hypothetical protein
MRLLVATYDVLINGGLFRFDRIGSIIRSWGHELAFVSLADRRLSIVPPISPCCRWSRRPPSAGML